MDAVEVTPSLAPQRLVGAPKVRYEYLTRRAAIEWQQRMPIDPADPLTDMRLRDHERSGMDDVVGVVAIVDGRIIGRNFFFHSTLSIHGHEVDCIVSHNLFVAPAYRPRGIGIYIKMHVLKLGYPQVSSGVSHAMQQVQDAWSAYRKIDSTPAFAIPVSPLGGLRVARLAAEGAAPGGSPAGTLHHLARQQGAAWWLERRADRALLALDAQAAAARMDRILDAERFPVQVPWNRALLRDALLGLVRMPAAGVYVKRGDPTAEPGYLMTGYTRRRTARGLGRRSAKYDEFHVNEVFPPVHDPLVAQSLLGHAVREARMRGADIVHFYATTETLQRVCEAAGLRSFVGKHVYIAPNSRCQTAVELLGTAQNWWCRVINEDQFEEVAAVPAGPKPDFAFLQAGR
jgi:GNAT superfamily N-acetyltransferase